MDSEDYLTGVDSALARYPEADSTRVGVSGGSYGGFMTNWLTATSDRFQAAVTSRSIVNLESLWGSSDIPAALEYEFFGASLGAEGSLSLPIPHIVRGERDGTHADHPQ